MDAKRESRIRRLISTFELSGISTTREQAERAVDDAAKEKELEIEVDSNDDRNSAFVRWLKSKGERANSQTVDAFEAGWEAAVAHYHIVDGERAEWETNGNSGCWACPYGTDCCEGVWADVRRYQTVGDIEGAMCQVPRMCARCRAKAVGELLYKKPID